MKLICCVLLKFFKTSGSTENEDSLNEDKTSDDRISSAPQVVDSSPNQNTLQYVYTLTGNHSRVFEESDSELSVNNVCANSNMSESVSIGGDAYYFESGSHDSVHSSNNAQESFQLSPMSPSLSMNVIDNIEYVPPNTIATISCSGISVYETALEGSVLLHRQESALRHNNDLNNSDDNGNNGQMKRVYNHFISHHHHDHSTQSIPKLYPIVGLHKELPAGIVLPPLISLDLPKVNVNREVNSIM